MMQQQGRWQDYLLLARIDKPTGTLLLLFPTYWALWLASHGSLSIFYFCLFTIGTFSMRCAGCIINDISDSDIDKYVKRTKDRPITAGRISKKQALLAFALFCLISFLCLFPLNWLSWKLSLLALFLTCTYPMMKRFFSIPQLYLGFAFSFGIIMAYAALLNTVPKVGWLIYLATIFWIVGYDTVYAISDKPDDLKLSIKSSAITFGRYDVVAVMICYAIFLALMVVVGYLYTLKIYYWLSLGIVSLLMIRQYPLIRNHDRLACYQAFLQNKWFGLLIWFGIMCSL